MFGMLAPLVDSLMLLAARAGNPQLHVITTMSLSPAAACVDGDASTAAC